MSEHSLNRGGSIWRSSKRRTRRRSTMSVSSHGGLDDGRDIMLQIFEIDEADEEFGADNNDEDNNNNNNNSLREDPRERGMRDMEKKMREAVLLQKFKDCKAIMDGVKHQDWKMSKKLMVHRKAKVFVDKFEGRLPRRQGCHQMVKQILKQLLRTWTNVIASLIPWEMKIKRIESHFGSVVASYFVFLRWLLWISLWLAIMPTCFIILPELLVGGAYGANQWKQVPDDEIDTAEDLQTMWNAGGIIKYSIIFYGYYGNSTTIGNGYRLPLAYLLTSLAAFVYSFVVVLKTMAHNSRQNRMSSKDEEFTFTWKMFTEWDYMIGSHETVTTKHASIATTFKEAIMEEQEKIRDGNKWLTVSLRVLANCIIILLLALSAYVVQLFVERTRLVEVKKRNSPNYELTFWEENELTVVITLISSIFPPILDVLRLMEKYHPRTNLRLMLARIFVLNLLNVYTLFIALYNMQNDLMDDLPSPEGSSSYQKSCDKSNGTSTDMTSTSLPFRNDSEMTSSVYVVNVTSTISQANVTGTPNCVSGNFRDLCWETMIGQEVFKLTVLDAAFTIGQILIQDVLRSYVVRYFNYFPCWDMEKQFPEYPDFKTAENLLSLISNQGVIWLGTFFNPGLPLVNLVKLLILMYLRFWTVMVYTVPEERIFRASRSNNFYYTLLLIMLFLCLLPPLFAIVVITPSPQCGPFRGQRKSYDILTDTILTVLPTDVSLVIGYLASPSVILPFFLLLGMVIYYLISMTWSLRDANNELRMQLEYERTDGRRKVYAMADAKHDSKGQTKGQGWKSAKTQAATSALWINMALPVLEPSNKAIQTVHNRNVSRGDATRAAKKRARSSKDVFGLAKKLPAVLVDDVTGKLVAKATSLATRCRTKQAAKYGFSDSLAEYARQKPDNGDNKGKGVWPGYDQMKDTPRQGLQILSKQENIKKIKLFPKQKIGQPLVGKFQRRNGQEVCKPRESGHGRNPDLAGPVIPKNSKPAYGKRHIWPPDHGVSERWLKQIMLAHTSEFDQPRSRYHDNREKPNVSTADELTDMGITPSGTFIDNNGHLKPYDDLSGNDGDDETEHYEGEDSIEDDDKEVTSNVSHDGDDETEHYEGEDSIEDDDKEVASNVSHDEDDDDSINESGWTFKRRRNTPRNGPPSSRIYTTRRVLSSVYRQPSNVTKHQNITKTTMKKQASTHIEIINESAEPKVSAHSQMVTFKTPRQGLQKTTLQSFTASSVPEIKVEDFSRSRQYSDLAFQTDRHEHPLSKHEQHNLQTGSNWSLVQTGSNRSLVYGNLKPDRSRERECATEDQHQNTVKIQVYRHDRPSLTQTNEKNIFYPENGDYIDKCVLTEDHAASVL